MLGLQRLGAINSATKKWFWIAEINALSEVVFVLCAFEGEMKPKNGNQDSQVKQGLNCHSNKYDKVICVIANESSSNFVYI